MTATDFRDADPATDTSSWRRPALAIALVAAVDILLFNAFSGINWLLTGVLIAAAIVAMHPVAAGERRLLQIVGVPALALLPLAENVSPLSLVIALAGLAWLALAASDQLRAGIASQWRRVAGFLLIAPFRFIADLVRWPTRQVSRTAGVLSPLLGWVMALAFGTVFIFLFGLANPIIEIWIAYIDPLAWLEQLDLARLILWIVAAIAVWPFLAPRLPVRLMRATGNLFRARPARPALDGSLAQSLVGRAALVRALVVFNAIFAVQTLMDAGYLWGGVALPDGLTYAEYAHRGAYPLIVTALLAAAFVLAAMRPGSATSADRTVRLLVYAWVAQNIWLVLSSILRLDLYVGVYSLTFWRVAAFLWMGLVAVGLALIIARIALDRSSEWLLSAALLSLGLLLYGCSFTNFAGVIARYNVQHSRELGGSGGPLDVEYIGGLGPAALPALHIFVVSKHTVDVCQYQSGATDQLVCPDEAAHMLATQLQADLSASMADWRGWSFRKWRLMRYLERNPAVSASPDPTEPAQ